MTGIGESYVCERCGATFTKGWSDEEAAAEARDLFPAAHLAVGQATVCDGCYREIMAWAETSAPDLLRDPPAVSSDPIGDAVHADAEAAREEIRADGLICPSCGQNYADLIGRHCLILVMDVRAPWCECRDGAQVPLLDAMVASGASPAVAWEKWQAAASISVADEGWWQTTIAFERDVIGTGPANFTGLLSALERP